MDQGNKPIRVLYSFPHKLGAERICYTAWQQVNGLAAAGADLLVFPGSIHKSVPTSVKVRPTLARGWMRIPYKVIGNMRAYALHDYIVSKRIEKLAGQIDIIHLWPQGALRTIKTAAKLGIPTVLERPNANTRFAYEVVQKECEHLGIALPPDHEHTYNDNVLRIEEEEFQLAYRLLCPSEFVSHTFLDCGFPLKKLARHQYGFDEKKFYPNDKQCQDKSNLTMLFVGGCAPRKGLHYALEAWLKSPASKEGRFMIAGEFVPGYAEKLSSMLSHQSIQVLGHRNDVTQLMRQSDILILPSIEEGSALVTSEARGSGCVLLVSEAAGAICQHMINAMVHQVGDVSALTQHLNLLYEDRTFLAKLRTASLRSTHEITWTAAGVKLLDVYHETIIAYAEEQSRTNTRKHGL